MAPPVPRRLAASLPFRRVERPCGWWIRAMMLRSVVHSPTPCPPCCSRGRPGERCCCFVRQLAYLDPVELWVGLWRNP
ncbi:hypothetical protein BRADI_4g17231v3 [Brachypodium distachyon]|uniref:Uncharacterized protein n=1 Tax=Brachypodium distachyon TaxID=15368 RepID=A0A2K2CNF4_BRADI|nr:hypothetical protein BRADI_4g17231v3 [Brachypodium distachyon]